MTSVEDALRATLRDSDPFTRLQAAANLAQLGIWDGRETLIAGLEDDDPMVRSEAAGHLAKIGPSWAIGPLARRLGDPQSTVRNDSILALGETNHVGAVPHLIAALEDEDLERREDARVSLVGLLGDGIRLVMAEMEEHIEDEAGKALAWWKENERRFPPAIRYVAGTPLDVGHLVSEIAVDSPQVIDIDLDRLTTWTGEDFGTSETPGVVQTWRQWWAKNAPRFPKGKRYYWGREVD